MKSPIDFALPFSVILSATVTVQPVALQFAKRAPAFRTTFDSPVARHIANSQQSSGSYRAVIRPSLETRPESGQHESAVQGIDVAIPVLISGIAARITSTHGTAESS